jgi:hypothetical protein
LECHRGFLRLGDRNNEDREDENRESGIAAGAHQEPSSAAEGGLLSIARIAGLSNKPWVAAR